MWMQRNCCGMSRSRVQALLRNTEVQGPCASGREFHFHYEHLSCLCVSPTPCLCLLLPTLSIAAIVTHTTFFPSLSRFTWTTSNSRLLPSLRSPVHPPLFSLLRVPLPPKCQISPTSISFVCVRPFVRPFRAAQHRNLKNKTICKKLNLIIFLNFGGFANSFGMCKCRVVSYGVVALHQEETVTSGLHTHNAWN